MGRTTFLGILACGLGLLLAGPSDAQFGGGAFKRGGMKGGGMRDGGMMGGRRGMMERDKPAMPAGADPVMVGAFMPMMSDPGHMKDRGLVVTGLEPVFPAQADCPPISSTFGSQQRYDGSYRSQRYFHGYHGGTDISADEGTPVLAMAAGEVVHKSEGGTGIGGIALYLKHAPEDTGLDAWTFTEYKHFQRMPDLNVGDRVEAGQVLGPAGKTGTVGGHYGAEGYSHLHFVAFWNETGMFKVRKTFLPGDGHWLDPLAMFRGGPLDSHALADLADAEKKVPIAYKTTDGRIQPEGAKVVWPFACTPR